MKKLFQLVKIELNALIRDRNWLLSQLINPILLIGIFTFLFPTIIGSVTRGNNLFVTIAVSGEKKSFIENKLINYGFDLRRVDDARSSVLKKDVDVGIQIIKSDSRETSLGEIKIYLIGSNLKTSLSYQRLKQALHEIILSKVANLAKLSSEDLSKINPVPINVESATQAAAGAFVFLIPILVFNVLFTTAQAIGVDFTAGSRERGELAAQISTPTSNNTLLLSKISFISLICIIQALWMIIWFFVLTFIRGQTLQNGFDASRGIELGSGSLMSIQNLFMFTFISIFTAFTFSAIVTAVGFASKTVRAANGWLGSVGLIITISGIVFQFADFMGRSVYLFVIPIVGSVISLLDAIKGDLSIDRAILNCLSSALITVLCVFWGARKIGLR